MENHSRRLEYKCTCTHFSVLYARGSILWSDSSSGFEVSDDTTTQVGYYTTWIDNVDPDSLRMKRIEIQQRAESFVLAMQFLGNANFSKSDESLSYILDTGEKHQIVDDCDIEAIIRRSRGESYNYCNVKLPAVKGHGWGHNSPVPLPKKMPSIPLILKRHILTVLQAEALDNNSEHYGDEQLKRWFLIIEELEPNQSSQAFRDLKCARHFVSHPTLHFKDTVAFLKRELPSSVSSIANGGEKAQYLRDDPIHRALVSKYETLARQWAKRLVENEIVSQGGNIQP